MRRTMMILATREIMLGGIVVMLIVFQLCAALVVERQRALDAEASAISAKRQAAQLRAERCPRPEGRHHRVIAWTDDDTGIVRCQVLIATESIIAP